MTKARQVAFAATGLALVILAAYSILEKTWPPAGAESRPAATNTAGPPSDPTDETEKTEETQRTESFRTSTAQIKGDWAALLAALKSLPTTDPEQSEATVILLTKTRLAWTAMDPQVRARAIQDLLDAGDDAITGLKFKVGPHGLLIGWPTLRVFLLDVLATADSEMASITAGKILDTTQSGDEFATALRSLTRQGLGQATPAQLLVRFDQMLARQDWQNSRGFAEALDLARYLGTSQAAQRLATWTGEPQLKSMAMDEFAADHPQAMLDALASQPEMTGNGRANLMARADPASPQQLSSVDTYLRRPDLTAAEADTFLKSYPLRNATTGYRLYAGSPAPYTLEQIKAGDLAAANQAATWATDPALEKYRPELLALQTRLAVWIRQTD